MTLDERDVEILKALFQLGDPSTKPIAERTGIPKSTVHYRLQNLRDSGVLRNELNEIDPDVLGLGVRIITHVTAEYEEGYHETVGQQLRDIEGVASVYFTMGDTDFIVISYLPNNTYVEHLVQEFEGIDGVMRTSSTLVITTIKEDTNPVRGYDLDSLKKFVLFEED
ncbi:Lrp/AsnC family transcriptional regulator [Halorubrum sp. 48-1-W]|uniref:Lrp/AsnC family transcriptional regulator n=1 Tax=Halorubrum sp. 48-1-W TaxID=2249761 RepID=UPI000DCDC63D|nr:Lrp/AsnC family transcriptional regulator [Halorubrum sp. 48-1-W]RAW43911.1 Lrp/AsnC family transcriptional regulator [Halorubrum sp. 48-1-W]